MSLKLVLLCIFASTKSITTSFDLGGVISGNRMAGVPLGHNLAEGEVDVEGICSEPGMACQNCSHAVTCIALPVGWLKMPLQECTDGFTCNAHQGRCSEEMVPECDVIGQKYQHTCEQVGIFPDAFDCRKFHLCSPPEGFPDGRPAEHRAALCPRHYGYNPQTAQCSIKLEHGQCSERPVPDCTIVGQTDALPSSPNHYYLCLLKHRLDSKEGILYPQVFICPHGWFFWDGLCRPEPQIIYTTDRNLRPDEKNTGQEGHFGPDDNHIRPGSGETGPDENHNMRPGSGETGPDGKHPEPGDGPNRSNERQTGPDDRDIGPNKDKESPYYKATTTRMESFFSTDKATTYAADTFLADKFDIANYESTDDVAPPMDEFTNSFESGVDFW